MSDIKTKIIEELSNAIDGDRIKHKYESRRKDGIRAVKRVRCELRDFEGKSVSEFLSYFEAKYNTCTCYGYGIGLDIIKDLALKEVIL